MIHYFIVFAALLLGFVFLAHILFGTTHEEYSNVIHGITVSFSVALRFTDGQFSNESRVDRALWYWIFMGTVNLLFLMILTSIVVDILLELMRDSRGSHPMWTPKLDLTPS